MENHIHRSRNVPRFLKFNSGQIPAVFDNSMTYYETIANLSLFVQRDVVDVINNNADATEDAINFMKTNIEQTTIDTLRNLFNENKITFFMRYDPQTESLNLNFGIGE